MALKVLGSLLLAWEIWALWGPGPTYTTIAWHYRDNGPWVALIVGAFSAWLYYHFMVEGRG